MACSSGVSWLGSWLVFRGVGSLLVRLVGSVAQKSTGPCIMKGRVPFRRVGPVAQKSTGPRCDVLEGRVFPSVSSRRRRRSSHFCSSRRSPEGREGGHQGHPLPHQRHTCAPVAWPAMGVVDENPFQVKVPGRVRTASSAAKLQMSPVVWSTIGVGEGQAAPASVMLCAVAVMPGSV